MSETIDLSTKSKTALKLLGGGVPNVPFQYGVDESLKSWGFSLNKGCLCSGESREYGVTTLNPVIGSSSGTFAAICLTMGFIYEDMVDV